MLDDVSFLNTMKNKEYLRVYSLVDVMKVATISRLTSHRRNNNTNCQKSTTAVALEANLIDVLG